MFRASEENALWVNAGHVACRAEDGARERGYFDSNDIYVFRWMEHWPLSQSVSQSLARSARRPSVRSVISL